MFRIAPFRIHFLFLGTALALIVVCGQTARAEQPNLAVSISGVPLQIERNDVISGTVTITLSGLMKPVDIAVMAFVNPSGTRSVEYFYALIRGKGQKLTGRGNGTFRLNLSRDLSTRVSVDPGNYQLTVYALVSTGKPAMSAHAFQDFRVAAEKSTVALVAADHNPILVGSQPGTDNTEATCRYSVENNTSADADLWVNEQFTIEGPEEHEFEPTVHHVKLKGGKNNSESIESAYSVRLREPGTYTLAFRAECEGAKPLSCEKTIEIGLSAPRRARELRFISTSANPPNADPGKPIRLNIKYEAVGISSYDNPSITEDVSISGPENVSVSKVRALDRNTDEGEAVYEARLSKPGSYRWKVAISAINCTSPEPASGSLTVICKEGPAQKAVWVCSGPVDTGSFSGLTISGSSGTAYDSRHGTTNTITWTEPPPTVSEGDEFPLSLSVTQNLLPDVNGMFSINLVNYSGDLPVVRCDSEKTGKGHASGKVMASFFPTVGRCAIDLLLSGWADGSLQKLYRTWTYEKRLVTPEATEPGTGSIIDVTPAESAKPVQKSNETGAEMPAPETPPSGEPAVPKRGEEATGHGYEAGVLDSILSGAAIEIRDGQLVVAAINAPFLSQAMGIAVGDKVTAIGGVSTDGKSAEEIQHLLQGSSGEDVTIEITRANGEKMTVLRSR